jgi:heme iron utilization protein
VSALTREAAALIEAQRWAALATLDGGEPSASMVAYALDEKGRGLLLFLSQLAHHTQSLVQHPRASLVVSEPDGHDGDPQRLQRVTLTGDAEVIPSGSEAFVDAGERYVARFPDALPRFELGDFLLFRFTPAGGRYVGGFARAARFTWEQIAEELGGI